MKKALFLTGAGTAITWDGKSTQEITCELIARSEFCKAIYQNLSTDEIKTNFEEIIYAIELLFMQVYSQQFSQTNRLNFTLPQVFDVKPKLRNAIEPFINKSSKAERVFYAEEFYSAILSVSASVKDYTLNISDKTDLNLKLNEFLKSVSATNRLRCYTTNYDRLFIDTANGFNFFDGFSVNGVDARRRSYRKQDLSRVITDRHCNCCYNLHGSVYWDIHFGGNKQFATFDEGFYGTSELNYPSMPQLVTVNPNEFQIVSPIITGYNKTQRTNLQPFNAFFNSFLQDCLECNVWFIIGFSFSDPHINNTLATALNSREKLPDKIVWVSLDENSRNTLSHNFDNQEFRRIINPTGQFDFTDYKNIQDFLFSSPDNKINLYFGGMKEFLTSKLWEKIF